MFPFLFRKSCFSSNIFSFFYILIVFYYFFHILKILELVYVNILIFYFYAVVSALKCDMTVLFSMLELNELAALQGSLLLEKNAISIELDLKSCIPNCDIAMRYVSSLFIWSMALSSPMGLCTNAFTVMEGYCSLFDALMTTPRYIC